ncbi:MAG: ankyrin repeat domain-containing protein [Planctomycetota bacterium]
MFGSRVHDLLLCVVVVFLIGCDQQRLERTDFPRKSREDISVSSPRSQSSVEAAQGQSGIASSTNSQRSDPVDALREAALTGDVDGVKRAIADGLNPIAGDEGGRTALHLASFEGHTDVVALLIDAGAGVDARDQAGRTALMYASTANHVATIRRLLDAGADPNLNDAEEQFTPLMFAAAEGQIDVVRVLLDAGANPNAKDADGESAIDFARASGHNEVVSLLEKATSD